MITLQTYIPQKTKQLIKSFWFLEVNTGDVLEEIAALEIASKVKIIRSIRSETLRFQPEMSLLP